MRRDVRQFALEGWTEVLFHDAGLFGPVVGGLEALLEESDAFRQPWRLDDGELYPQRGLVDTAPVTGCGTTTFQYSPGIHRGLRASGAQVKGYEPWLDLCRRLWCRAFTTCLIASQQLDREYSGMGFVEALDREASILQILRVAPDHSGPRRHIDVFSVSTLHIAESLPALQFDEGPAPQTPRRARLFAGGQMTAHTLSPEAKLADPATWGGAIRAKPHWGQLPEERTTPWWAIVLFARGKRHLSPAEAIQIRNACLG